MMGWLMFLHLFGVVLWIAGVLAADWLMLEHAALLESPSDRAETAAAVFSVLEKKYLFRLAHPGMLLALTGGLAMLALNPGYYLGESWMRAKLILAGVLILATVALSLARRSLRQESSQLSRGRLRRWHRVFVAAVVLIFLCVFVKPI